MKNYNIALLKRPLRRAVLGIGLITSIAGVPGAVGANINDAIVSGKVAADLRYRYEMVDQQSKTEKAQAAPMRLRLGYGTGVYSGVSAFMEFEHVFTLGTQQYNSTTNNKTEYPVVADPTTTELNQAFVGFTALPATDIKLGRQRIVLDNARFVGNVGWRQNEQTFDAVMLTNQSLPGARLFYALLKDANTITGADDEMTSHLLNASYKAMGFGTLTAYGYFLHFDAKPDTRTMGLRFAGKKALVAKTDVLYTVEYARQNDFADNTGDFNYGYGLVEAGVGVKGVTAKVGYEVLGGDGNASFQTPLATKHAFNGWADQFLATPGDGLADLYLSVGAKLFNTKFAAVVHDYKAEEGGAHYGREWGALAVKPLGKMYSLGFKYANYKADTHAVDIDKLWLTAHFRF